MLKPPPEGGGFNPTLAETINEIKTEGKDRYDKKIPPGFKDDVSEKQKNGKQYGDLIIWHQMMDKANAIKKPIIFVSEDVKEDWWLVKDSNRIMPLPQLKKEFNDKTGVDFHIYTAEQFLKHYPSETKDKKNNEEAIKEVKKISEQEEKRMRLRRMELRELREPINTTEEIRSPDRYFVGYLRMLEMLHNLITNVQELNIPPDTMEELWRLFQSVRDSRNRVSLEEPDRRSIHILSSYVEEILIIIERFIRSERIIAVPAIKCLELIEKLRMINRRLRLTA